jgi:hypothetical protein
MTKFHFRLASVLRLREVQLAVEEEKLQILLGELAQMERSLAAMSEERSAAIAFVQKQTGMGHAELRALSAFLLGTGARQAQYDRELEVVAQETWRAVQNVLRRQSN